MLLNELTLYFSYSQFIVCDASVKLPGLAWTEVHSNQGFIRMQSVVNFGTLLEFGDAKFEVFEGGYEYNEKDERVIAVPFYCSTGKVRIEAPETEHHSIINLKPRHYKLTAAQQIIDEDTESIRLYFSKISISITKSEIIIADDKLNLPSELAEDGEIA